MSGVLVTGASGLIGSRVVAQLAARGDEVHAVARRAPVGTGDSVRWHTADLLDAHDRERVVADAAPDRLVHLAWNAEHGAFWNALDNPAWAGATADLVRAVAAAGAERAVLAGSCAEYEWGGEAPCSEAATLLRPGTLYGVSKDAARRMSEALAAQEGLSLAWGRVFFLYGPGEDERRLVASVARALLQGQPARTSSGTQVRDFLHADDVAGAFIALLDSQVEGAVNIGSGEGVALRTVVETIAVASGRPELLEVGALPDRPDDPAVLVPDTTRLTGETGWQPAIGLDEGLAGTLEWWRRELASA